MLPIAHTAPLHIRVASDGVGPHWAEVAAVAAAAELRGAPGGLLGALRDPSEPPVVRQRAFGLAEAYAARPLPADTVTSSPGRGLAAA
jgi:hypothetical protein